MSKKMKDFEKNFLNSLDDEDEKSYAVLKNLLEKIAKNLKGCRVAPIVVNGKDLDYIIVKKSFLWRVTLLRAYFTSGYTPDAGGWTEVTIAYKKIPSTALQDITADKINVSRVNLNDYNTEKRSGFH